MYTSRPGTARPDSTGEGIGNSVLLLADFNLKETITTSTAAFNELFESF